MADTVNSAAAAPAGDELARAHAHLLADRTLQFKFDQAPPPPETPDWLIALGRFLESQGPLFKAIVWLGLALLAILIVWLIVRAAMDRVAALRRRTPATADALPAPAPFQPPRERAMALLSEADELAGQGRFSEAARVLLHRTIEDMERASPLRIGEALTSREIGQLPTLSAQGRAAFARIARAVETSLFGARPLDAENFAACRAAYESFAFGGAGR